MIRAIFFDCFGVVITDALKVVIDELTKSNPEAAQQIHDIIHANNRGLISPDDSNRQIADVLGVSVEAWRNRIEKGEIKDERLLAYIRELRSHYKIGLLSNVGRQSIQRRFSPEELETYFDAVVASGDLGVMKPDPEIYLRGAEMLGVQPEECLMVDDRETHCGGAEAVGMETVLYRSYGQGRRALEALLRRQ